MDLVQWENRLEKKIAEATSAEDPAHDLSHFRRVVATAKALAQREGADPWVVVPAAWLHDLVIVPKNSPLRSRASRLSAERAREFLFESSYPADKLDGIAHAIEAHSFSAGIEARTIEARVVQDADRLDGLGAIGLARCFVTAGLLRRPLYSEQDPFCEQRDPNDQEFTVDHFFVKLFRTAEMMGTEAGREEARRRVELMKAYLRDLERELGGQISS